MSRGGWDFGGAFAQGYDIGDRMAERRRTNRRDAEEQNRYAGAQAQAAQDRDRASAHRAEDISFKEREEMRKGLESTAQIEERMAQARLFDRMPQDRASAREASKKWEVDALTDIYEEIQEGKKPERDAQNEWSINPWSKSRRPWHDIGEANKDYSIIPQTPLEKEIVSRRNAILKLGQPQAAPLIEEPRKPGFPQRQGTKAPAKPKLPETRAEREARLAKKGYR